MCMVNITVSSFSSVSCNLDSWKVILVSINKQKLVLFFCDYTFVISIIIHGHLILQSGHSHVQLQVIQVLP